MSASMDAFEHFIIHTTPQLLPHLSVDCVVFGFHENHLKVLLLKNRYLSLWGLPGGFVYRDESLEMAASRVLRERTGLDNIFLQQFHVFSDPVRSDNTPLLNGLRAAGILTTANDWLAQRFLSVGFYALVDFSKVTPMIDPFSDDCAWQEMTEIPTLMLDHNQILHKAMETIRLHLSHQPIGYNLLPEKFTMPELQRLYETILGKMLDRRNFQRKILGYGILKRWEERRKGGAHKAPYLYSFDPDRYQQALREGLPGEW